MLKVFIVDDESPALDLLALFLGETRCVEVLARFDRADPVLMAVLAMRPDAVFLDIEMPGMSGLELASQINAAAPETEIVFVTAYDQHALEAFRVNAVDYILKPLRRQSVAEAVDRLSLRCRRTEQPVFRGGYALCFGGFDIYADESCQKPLVKWRTAKSREMFAYLYAQQGRSVSKWSLCEMLWPDMDEQRLTAYFHTTLYQTKKALRAALLSAEILYENGGYQLRSFESIPSDVAEFSRLTDGESKSAGEDDIARLERAVALYQGEYMGSQGYIWALSLAEYYKEIWTAACRCLTAFYLESGNSAQAVLLLQKALLVSPLNEPLHHLLLELYAEQDDRAAYIGHYRRFAAILQSELGVPPPYELTRQYELYLIGNQSKGAL